MSVGKTLADLAHEYETAKAAYDEAERATSVARSNECGCLNRLNAAQKAWDAYVEDLKTKAPRDSDWKRRPSFKENTAV